MQRIYCGNHNSHADFALIWASLPIELRHMTRPITGTDYWNANALKRYIIHEVLRDVVIERSREGSTVETVNVMAAVHAGDSLIIFPEGTRNTTDELLLPMKSGIYRLAQQCPQVELVPVWMDNLGGLLPKARHDSGADRTRRDILHHVCSRFCGSHQLAPQVSPNKTVEGFIGGIASAVEIGMLLSWITPVFRARSSRGDARHYIDEVFWRTGGQREIRHAAMPKVFCFWHVKRIIGGIVIPRPET